MQLIDNAVDATRNFASPMITVGISQCRPLGEKVADEVSVIVLCMLSVANLARSSCLVVSSAFRPAAEQARTLHVRGRSFSTPGKQSESAVKCTCAVLEVAVQ